MTLGTLRLVVRHSGKDDRIYLILVSWRSSRTGIGVIFGVVRVHIIAESVVEYKFSMFTYAWYPIGVDA